jgi:hypothetical protein
MSVQSRQTQLSAENELLAEMDMQVSVQQHVNMIICFRLQQKFLLISVNICLHPTVNFFYSTQFIAEFFIIQQK